LARVIHFIFLAPFSKLKFDSFALKFFGFTL